MRLILVLIILLAPPAFAATSKPFPQWLAGLKKEAVNSGISPEVFDRALDGIEPSEDVLELDQKQPEKTKTFLEYKNGIVKDERIDKALELWQSHKNLFARIDKIYHVPAPILLALWGIESNFGKLQGHNSVIESLVTLAYDGRRSQFFRTELLAALAIIEQEKIAPEDLTGSWAGAMGQVQFMPSSFLKFAVDFDHNGKKDIWESDDDALASMANYLHQKGWDESQNWGVRISLPLTNTNNWRAMKEPKSMNEWQKLGIRYVGGGDLPQSSDMARLIIPDSQHVHPAYLVTPNYYNVLLDWNRSTYFATTVGLLADEIGKQ